MHLLSKYYYIIKLSCLLVFHSVFQAKAFRINFLPPPLRFNILAALPELLPLVADGGIAVWMLWHSWARCMRMPKAYLCLFLPTALGKEKC